MTKTICLATFEFDPITQISGIGTYYSDLAKLLAEKGWDVRVLFHSYERKDIRKYAEEYFAEHNVSFYDASTIASDSGKDPNESFRDALFCQGRSQVFHNAISALTDEYDVRFDLIEFPDWGATAFIPVQMKKNFGKYKKTKIIVKLHGPDEWGCEGNQIEWTSFESIKQSYLERYAFEGADVQVSPTRYMLDWCSKRGWNVRPDATICPLPGPSMVPTKPADLGQRNEIVFFGRFEFRKGITDFVSALQYARAQDSSFPGKWPITFLGKDFECSGYFSRNEIARKLDGFETTFVSFPARDEAITYLRDNARLVVVPSRQDNFPNTVLECMMANVPFVTSRLGGIPELLQIGSELYESVSVQTERPEKFANLLLRHLALRRDRLQRLLALAEERARSLSDPNRIVSWYQQQLDAGPSRGASAGVEAGDNRVTVLIVTRDDSVTYLGTALRSLQLQTYQNFEVSIKDGSADPESILKVENLAKKHQVKRVIHQQDSDLGNACNQALPYVRTKYLVRLDADNVAKPTMLDTFVRSIHSRRDVAALSCYQASFENNEEAFVLNILKNEKQHVPRGYYKPIGPCLPVLFFQNTAGDANSIYVTDALRTVGGWPEGKGHSDWGLWLKLLGGGYLVDVIPEILYYYRARPDSGTSQVTSFGVNECLIQIIQEMITARPELLSDQWRSLHQLVRRLGVVDAELERYKKTALRRPAVVDAELERYKKTALYALDRKFAELAHKSEKLTKLLVLSGRVIRWLSAG